MPLLGVFALALTMMVAGAVNVAPFAGAVRLTVGGAPDDGAGAGFTVMLTGAEVAVSPALLVALAVSEYVPATTLLQPRL
jgi:hypothetical protein